MGIVGNTRATAENIYRVVRGEGTLLLALQGLIVLLFGVAVAAAVKTSLNGTLHFEIIVETCSFLGALVLVAAQHRASRRALRARAIKNVVNELVANATELTSGELMRTRAELLQAMDDYEDGVRYYYSQLATTASRSALISGALDGHRDQGLVHHLNQWVHDCEACNRRFMMSELRLFSTTADEVGVRERVRIHVSIVTGPAVSQREALARISEFICSLQQQKSLPKRLTPLVNELTSANATFGAADAIVAEVDGVDLVGNQALR